MKIQPRVHSPSVQSAGAANASFQLGRYQPKNFEGRDYNERDWSATALHSAWFTLLAEHGSVGVLIVMLMILHQFSLIRRLRRDVRARADVPDDLRREVETFALGLNGSVVAFLGSGLFLSVLYYPYLWYFTVFASTLDLAVRGELARLQSARAPDIAAA